MQCVPYIYKAAYRIRSSIVSDIVSDATIEQTGLVLAFYKISNIAARISSQTDSEACLCHTAAVVLNYVPLNVVPLRSVEDDLSSYYNV